MCAFAADVAAIAKSYSADMARKVDGKSKTTVLASLQFATRPRALEYLMNNSRFFARNPALQGVFEATRNEAFHKQLKGYWRNVIS